MAAERVYYETMRSKQPGVAAQIDKNTLFGYFETSAPRYAPPSPGLFIGASKIEWMVDLSRSSQLTIGHVFSKLNARHPAWTCASRGFCLEIGKA